MSMTISRFPAAGNEVLIATLRLLALLCSAGREGSGLMLMTGTVDRLAGFCQTSCAR